MSQIPNLEKHLSDGVRALVPDRAEELWQQPVEPADGTEWFLASGKKSKKVYWISAVAAGLVLCLLSSFWFLPTASVYLDVNPSVTLEVSVWNRVTHAEACNADGEVVLGDMDLRGTDLDVALYAVLGSMVHHGYLTEAQDTVLVSVQSKDPNRAEALQVTVSDVVSQGLEEMLHAGEVLSCQVDAEAEEPEENSPGKAAFIRELQERYPQLAEENLEDMSMDEIVALLTEEDLDYSDFQEKETDPPEEMEEPEEPEDDEDEEEDEDEDDEEDEDEDDEEDDEDD